MGAAVRWAAELNTLGITEEENVMNNPYLVVSGAIFGVVAAAHLTRAFLGVPVHIGASEIPIWVSWLGAVVSGALCVWALRSRGKQ